MKRLNSKGIGHHLLIIAVVVTAVIGGAGYFVWQRQSDNNLEAKAAGYTDLSTINTGGRGDGTPPNIKWKGCITQPNRSSNFYNLTIIAQRVNPAESATVKVGYIRNSAWTYTGTKSTWPKNNIVRFAPYQVRLTDEGAISSSGPNGGGKFSFNIKAVTKC